MKATINKIDQELRLLADAHLQINSYFYGRFLDTYESNKVNHCSLLANITDVSVDRHYVNMQLSLMVCDKIDDGKSLDKNVDSMTLQVANDLIKVITTSSRWQQFGVVSDSTSLQGFTEKGGSVLNGWMFKLNFKVKNENGYCDLPIVDYSFDNIPVPIPTPPIVPVCEPLYGEPFTIIQAQTNNILDNSNLLWRFTQVLESDSLIGTWNNNTFTNSVVGNFEFIIETDLTFSGTDIADKPELLINYVSNSDLICDSDNWVTQVGQTITYYVRFAIGLGTIGTTVSITSNQNGGILTQLAGGTIKIGYTE